MTRYWLKKLEERAHRHFVGREHELEFFDTLLNAPDPAYLMVHIAGIGGVGKTSLLERIEAGARMRQHLVVRISGEQRFVSDILDKIHQDVRRQGENLTSFAAMHRAHSELLAQLRADPEFHMLMLENSGRVYALPSGPLGAPPPAPRPAPPAPAGYNLAVLREFLTVALTEQEIVQLCYDEPPLRGVYEQFSQGMAKDRMLQLLIDFCERQRLLDTLVVAARRLNATRYEEYRERLYPAASASGPPREPPADDEILFFSYLYHHNLTLEQREMLVYTDRIFAAALLDDLDRIGQRRRIVLIFDDWEVLAPFADDWLRNDLLDPNLERIGPSLTLITAGREALARSWGSYDAIIRQIELKPFSPQEAEEFLLQQGVTDPAAMRKLQELSGNIPLLLSLLASGMPAPNDRLLVRQGVVETFLQEITRFDSLRRKALIACAFPRAFDEQLIARLLPGADPAALGAWLRSLAFVNHQEGIWRYHSIVRRLIMQHRFDSHPEEYFALHEALAQYYEMRLAGLSTMDYAQRNQRFLQAVELEQLYHTLCQDRGLGQFLTRFVEEFRRSPFAQDLINLFMEVQEELQDRSSFQEWYRLFGAVPQCRTNLDSSLPAWIPLFERLIDQTALSAPPIRGKIHYTLGYYYAVEQRYQQAEEAYRQALVYQPEHVSARNGLALVYEQSGRLAEAETLFRACLELAPHYIYPYFHLGRLLHKLGRNAEAATVYEQAIALRPTSAEGYIRYGAFLTGVGDWPAAERMLRRAVQLDPFQAEAHAGLGVLLRRQGALGAAEEHLTQAITIDAAHNQARMQLALLLAGLGRVEEAMLQVRACTALSSALLGPHIQLARLLERAGRTAEALEVYLQAVQLAPHEASLRYVAAEQFARQQRIAEARDWLRAYLALQPDDPQARQLADDLCARFGISLDLDER